MLSRLLSLLPLARTSPAPTGSARRYEPYMTFDGASARFGTVSGVRDGTRIRAVEATTGPVLYGGALDLLPGRYQVLLRLCPGAELGGRGVIKIGRDDGVLRLALRDFDAAREGEDRGTIELDFEAPEPCKRTTIVVSPKTALSMTIDSLEIRAEEGLIPQAAPRTARDLAAGPLHILYLSCHEQLEFDEMRLLTDLGHRVFSIGAFLATDSAGYLRRPLPAFFDPEDEAEYGRIGFVEPFLARFDVAIVMHEVKWLEDLLQRRVRLPVIYRSIGQSSRHIDGLLARYRDRMCVLRYSEGERDLDGTLAADAVVYFAKYLADFAEPWIGGDRIVTFHNAYATRDSYPPLSAYEELRARLPCDLYGAGNESIAGAKGAVSPDGQAEVYRRAALYLYVYTTPPSYTLSFIEALGSGVPIVAPRWTYVMRHLGPEDAAAMLFTPERYEIERLLDHDPRQLYASTEEAEEKMRWLLAHPEACREISARQRETFARLFDAAKIGPRWDALLRDVAAGRLRGRPVGALELR